MENYYNANKIFRNIILFLIVAAYFGDSYKLIVLPDIMRVLFNILTPIIIYRFIYKKL